MQGRLLFRTVLPVSSRTFQSSAERRPKATDLKPLVQRRDCLPRGSRVPNRRPALVSRCRPGASGSPRTGEPARRSASPWSGRCVRSSGGARASARGLRLLPRWAGSTGPARRVMVRESFRDRPAGHASSSRRQKRGRSPDSLSGRTSDEGSQPWPKKSSVTRSSGGLTN